MPRSRIVKRLLKIAKTAGPAGLVLYYAKHELPTIQLLVLKALHRLVHEYGMGTYTGFAPLQKRLKRPRKAIRAACRALARKGLAKYSNGLWRGWDDDYGPGGAGYTITEEGVSLIMLLERKRKNVKRSKAI